jgi:hypothetical protein
LAQAAKTNNWKNKQLEKKGAGMTGPTAVVAAS